MAYLLLIITLLASLFLIMLILIQRGKGGGLAGAFGGMGGQSAFGAKAGPITKFTVYVAIGWFVLCAVSVRYFNRPDTTLDTSLGSDAITDTVPGVAPPAGGSRPLTTGEGAAPTGTAPDAGTPDAATPAGDTPTE